MNMGRSSEAYQYQQEQENESGIDMHDCYHACHPLERNEFNELMIIENGNQESRAQESKTTAWNICS
jgi:hypothetical protein